ncbi:hypothetical protein FACS189450_11440 [Spirochaetia bacterium]|nr:hypothetical protein FACS189450_11440 [Spirochaetia bacterium]
MRSKLFLSGMFSIMLVFGFIVLGCNTGNNPSSTKKVVLINPPEKNIQVYLRDDTEYKGNAAVNIEVGGKTIQVGSIASGILTIDKLPETIDEADLIGFDARLTIDPDDAKYFNVAVFNIVENGTTKQGQLQYHKDTYVNGTDIEQELNQVMYRYFQKDVLITGTMNGQWTYPESQVKIDIVSLWKVEGKKGWNHLYGYATYNAEKKEQTRHVVTDVSEVVVPKDLKWIIKWW